MPTASQRGGLDERAALLEPDLLALFDDAFVRACDLYEEYVFRLTCRIFDASGLAAAFAEPRTVSDAIERAGLSPTSAAVPVDWMCRLLVSRGRLRDASGPGAARYALATREAALDPGEIRAEQERLDPRAAPSFAIAALAAEHYLEVIRGEISGEQALFGFERMNAWSDYFTNENVLYAISNALAAIAAEPSIPRAGGRVLELGGGLGSGAAALCTKLVARGEAHPGIDYRFTELSIPFLRRARSVLEPAFPGVAFRFSRLDMNAPFAEAGVALGSVDVAYAVNALHVARDLEFTLGQIRDVLCPGGSLVAGECLRPFPQQPVHFEFVFNLLDAFQHPQLHSGWRPNGGFLTPEQWTRALEENGFRDIRLVPDVVAIRDAYPSFVVAAIVARRA